MRLLAVTTVLPGCMRVNMGHHSTYVPKELASRFNKQRYIFNIMRANDHRLRR
jgi:hypothetical protein